MCLSSPQRATVRGLQNKVQERHQSLDQQWLHPLGALFFSFFHSCKVPKAIGKPALHQAS